ncbi:TPA: hypothetical protein ACMFP8_006284 [Pseudomonas aeruginosa]
MAGLSMKRKDRYDAITQGSDRAYDQPVFQSGKRLGVVPADQQFEADE